MMSKIIEQLETCAAYEEKLRKQMNPGTLDERHSLGRAEGLRFAAQLVRDLQQDED